MAVDPAVQAVLDLLAAAGGPPLEEQTPEEARASFAGLTLLAGTPPDVARTERLDADGVPVIVHWPEGDGPHPVMIWIHGGGWTVGSAELADTTARDLCQRASCIVVNVDYRLAPEHRFPTAVDDVIAVNRWVQSTIASHGGDPTRVAVGGDSAGGNLAAVLSQEMPTTLVHQALVYPVTDGEMTSRSLDENGEGYLLTRKGMEWFRSQYVGDPTSADLRDPRLSPLHASDDVIARVPSATVITAEYDPLRDEGEAYADAMKRAGVEVDAERYDGMIHAFFSMPAAVPAAIQALDRVATNLRRAFGT
jgi:acetyl esterase